jgi:predicted metal-dependent hydrolase
MRKIAGRIPIVIRRHPRAKRMILRFSHDGRALHLTLSKNTTDKAGLAFVQSQKDWIALQRRQFRDRVRIPFAPDAIIPLFGRDCRLVHVEGERGTRYTGASLRISGDPRHFSRRVLDWVKAEARARFSEMATEIAAELGVRVAAVTVRDTKTRWGSCSKTRRISLSWRLAFAPEEVARYVIAHEIAHIKHFDHSPAFWRVVEKLDPDWVESRDWLSHYGKTLHDFG